MALSPGEYWRLVPKDRAENTKFRLALLERCESEPVMRKAVWEMCRQDLLFYVNVFVWQYNPRKKAAEVGPFITWPFQESAAYTLLDCIENDEDLTIEKSREMGATWWCLIVMEWLWHFHPWKKFLAISRNEKAVEDEDPDSLFWKLDFIHRYMPGWLMPKKLKRRKLYFGNEDNGSTITGQASTGSAGVGGRATAMFVDEFSQIKEDYEVLHRTSDTTGCRIFNFTHLGLDTAAYELTTRVDMRKLQMHWTQHPDKIAGLYRYDAEHNRIEVLDKTYHYPPGFNFVMDASPSGGPFPGLRSPWYDEQCRRKGSPRAIAMDLDINPVGSVSQFVDPLQIRQLIGSYCCEPYWEGELAYDRDTGRPEKEKPLRQVAGGLLKLWLTPTADGRPPVATYVAGADLAEGTGATNSCLTIINAETGEKVLEYADRHIGPEKFAPLAVALCWLFKSEQGEGARFAWEMQGPGDRFGKAVVALGYSNVYFRQNEQSMYNNRTASEIPGWYPSPSNRTLLLGDYRAALYSRQCLNRSEKSLREFLTFRYNVRGDVEYGGKSSGDDLSGVGVNHGDRVVADGLAWKMAKGMGLARTPGRPKEEVGGPGSLQWRRDREGRLKEAQEAWA